VTPPPLSLYVHLPWCVSKCPYCDFNSHKAALSLPDHRYVEALLVDLAQEAARAGGRRIETIFFGGGTPSLFGAGEIGEIIAAARSLMSVARDAEITMEANPGTVERGRLAGYRLAGVNRLSLGVQSFDGESLRRLGRIHGPAEVFEAWRDAREAAFDSVNLDLMYALPGQSVAGALADVRQALALSPQHVSWYQLTLEPNTVFYASPPADLPEEDAVVEIEETGRGLLAGAGYEQYEVSAFALPGHRCRHNLNYWQFGDYLGVGAGAHGKLTGEDGSIRRYAKPGHPLAYMQACEAGSIPRNERLLDSADVAFEYMLNALRLPGGFREADFVARSGLAWSAVAGAIERALALGLMEPGGGGNWRPTARGRQFLNELQGLFLPETQPARPPQERGAPPEVAGAARPAP
jgi:putative oxygen-independent coproporphyrinogen III oxidase